MTIRDLAQRKVQCNCILQESFEENASVSAPPLLSKWEEYIAAANPKH